MIDTTKPLFRLVEHGAKAFPLCHIDFQKLEIFRIFKLRLRGIQITNDNRGAEVE